MPSDQSELAYGLLDDLGASGLEEQDREDGSEIIAYFRAEEFEDLSGLRRAILGRLQELEAAGSRLVRMREFRDRDWARDWLQFDSLELAPGVWVRPSWSQLPSDAEPELVIDLDPGMAFGTGQHATTRLAATFLRESLQGAARRVLDLGCGTGILAIVAARSGASSVQGIEIDPVAADIARENVEKNGASAEILTGALEELDLSSADIVVGNLNSGILIDLASSILGLTQPGGQVIVSGIRAGTEAKVAEALVAAGARVLDQRTEDGWSALVLESTRARS